MRRRPPPVDPADTEAAYALAVRKLARQPLSRATLEDRLRRTGYADEAVRAAADRAAGRGYLDDQEYARALVRRRSQGRGQALIAQELRAKGVDDAVVAKALEGEPEESERERAMALARRLLGARRPANRQALLALVGPKLSRRGFPSGLIHRICQDLSQEWAAAPRFDALSEHD